MSVPSHALPVVRQCQLLNLSRSSVYYTPQPVSAGDLALMRRIDELHLHHPFAGARMLRDLLGQEGFIVGRRHVGTLMQKLGIEALYRRNCQRRHKNVPPRRNKSVPPWDEKRGRRPLSFMDMMRALQ